MKAGQCGTETSPGLKGRTQQPSAWCEEVRLAVVMLMSGYTRVLRSISKEILSPSLGGLTLIIIGGYNRARGCIIQSAFDFFHQMAKRNIILHPLLDQVEGVNDGRMVPAELLADARKRTGRYLMT